MSTFVVAQEYHRLRTDRISPDIRELTPTLPVSCINYWKRVLRETVPAAITVGLFPVSMVSKSHGLLLTKKE